MRTCFTTYVYGDYQDYIPIYIYSILYHWPQHYVKIFLKETLEPRTVALLDLIRKEVGANFEIVENYESQLKHLPAARFLLSASEFEGYDYIYFGDVDFIIYNFFNDNFSQYYVDHCSTTGLPFSNEWHYDWGCYRATGLHFVIKEPYFAAVTPIMEELRDLKSNFHLRTKHHPKWPSYDEEMLFYLLVNSFNLQPLQGYRRPLHGVHFGTFRILGINDSFASMNLEVNSRNNLPVWKNDLHKINKIFKSPLMAEMRKGLKASVQETILKVEMALYRKMFL